MLRNCLACIHWAVRLNKTRSAGNPTTVRGSVNRRGLIQGSKMIPGGSIHSQLRGVRRSNPSIKTQFCIPGGQTSPSLKQEINIKTILHTRRLNPFTELRGVRRSNPSIPQRHNFAYQEVESIHWELRGVRRLNPSVPQWDNRRLTSKTILHTRRLNPFTESKGVRRSNPSIPQRQQALTSRKFCIPGGGQEVKPLHPSKKTGEQHQDNLAYQEVNWITERGQEVKPLHPSKTTAEQHQDSLAYTEQTREVSGVKYGQ